MVKFLSPFWAAAVCLQIVWLVQRMQNVDRISNCQGRAEGRNFLLQISSMWCGSDRQVCLFTKTTRITIFPLAIWRKSFWKEFTAAAHCLISELLVLPIPRGANCLLGYVKLPMSCQGMQLLMGDSQHLTWFGPFTHRGKRRERRKLKCLHGSCPWNWECSWIHTAEGSSEVGLLPRQGKCSISYVNPMANLCRD